MSTDGTKPPSIAPKKPAGSSAGGPGTRTDTSTRAQPAVPEAPSTGARATPPRAKAPQTPSAPSTDPAPAGPSGSGPSVTERLKKAASGAAESARNAMPSREESSSTEGTGTTGTVPPTGRPSSTAPSADRARTTTTSTGPAPAAAPTGPRRVRLAVSKIDPWSVMKLSFLLSVAIGIMIVVAAAVTWYALDALAVFTQVNDVIATLTGDETYLNLLDYVGFERVVSLAVMIAVVDVVLLTALSTIGAFLYNITAALVGGVHLTLTDD